MQDVIRLPFAGLPKWCESCGRVSSEWPLGVHGGRVGIVCPECHVIVMPVVAVPKD